MTRARCAPAVVAAAIAWLIAGCDATAVPSPGTPPAAAARAADAHPDARHEAGRKIYNFRCYYCHGYSGDAKTLATRFLEPKPRDFSALAPGDLGRDAMLRSVADGVSGTAMAGFGRTLTPGEIELVVDFVREEFVRRKAVNTRYHTAANGWPGHERYRAAYPFATGEIPLDRPWSSLSDEQSAGRRLYMASCVSCHDRSNVVDAGAPWQLRGVSYPPGNYEEGEDHHRPPGAGQVARAGEAPASAHADDTPVDPYELHEEPPKLVGASRLVVRGERVFQANCAHCHAADGTGRNWIGSFLEPSPPDFTRSDVASRLTRVRVATVTRDGIAATSMPAWRAVLDARDLDAVSAYVEHVFVRQATLSRSEPR